MNTILKENFEDDLCELIDQYLIKGIDIEELRDALRFEAENDFEQVLSALKSWARRETGGKDAG